MAGIRKVEAIKNRLAGPNAPEARTARHKYAGYV
jgi:hypothetical protein